MGPGAVRGYKRKAENESIKMKINKYLKDYCQ
jgi:hypothetical protein